MEGIEIISILLNTLSLIFSIGAIAYLYTEPTKAFKSFLIASACVNIVCQLISTLHNVIPTALWVSTVSVIDVFLILGYIIVDLKVLRVYQVLNAKLTDSLLNRIRVYFMVVAGVLVCLEIAQGIITYPSDSFLDTVTTFEVIFGVTSILFDCNQSIYIAMLIYRLSNQTLIQQKALVTLLRLIILSLFFDVVSFILVILTETVKNSGDYFTSEMGLAFVGFHSTLSILIFLQVRRFTFADKKSHRSKKAVEVVVDREVITDTVRISRQEHI